jgi:predicted amidophosphoribosyltransferase
MDAMAAGHGIGLTGVGPRCAGPASAEQSSAEQGSAEQSSAEQGSIGQGLAGWDLLSGVVAAHAGALSAPVPFAAGLCRTCFGPAQAGGARCFQCRLHAECASGSLASVVVPVAYAVKGGPLARSLWLYKSSQAGAAAARCALTALLLVFLREHGPCVWREASWATPARTAGPTHLAVVPSCRGRTGFHPLRSLAEPYLRLPWATLTARSGADGDTRDLDPGRFAASGLDGARVLLLDDTWTTGASAQSATMALRRAGASAVAVVVLGRHLGPPRPGQVDLTAAAFSAGRCAVHVLGDAEP